MSDEKSVTTSLKLSGVSLTISCVALSVENCSLQFQSRTKACKMKKITEMQMFEIAGL